MSDFNNTVKNFIASLNKPFYTKQELISITDNFLEKSFQNIPELSYFGEFTDLRLYLQSHDNTISCPKKFFKKFFNYELKSKCIHIKSLNKNVRVLLK